MSRDISSYDRIDLGPKPAEDQKHFPADVGLLQAGPGRLVTFAEAVQLAEDAYNSGNGKIQFGVISATEISFGWMLMLQSLEYIETRDDQELIIGHGPTIVDRENGDVYGCSGLSLPWESIAECERLRSKRTS